MKIGVQIILFFVMMLISCKSSQPSHEAHVVEREQFVLKSNRDVVVPKALIEEIKVWQKKQSYQDHKTPIKQEVNLPIKRYLLDLEMVLSPIKGEALDHSVRFMFPTGGGQLDLADVVQGSKGGFYFAIQLSKFNHEINKNNLRIFFISGAKIRQLEDKELGLGCHRWVEVTQWFHKNQKKKSLELFAFHQHYLSVVSGTWVLAWTQGQELYLGSITLTDSRYPSLLCTTPTSFSKES